MINALLHIVAAALVCALHGNTPPPIFVLAMITALLPDIDTPKSLIGNLLLPISLALERSVGHRTATHSLLAVALIAAAAYLWLNPWWLVIAGAYGSHIIIDLLIGPSGVVLFWPAGDRMTIAGWRDDGPAPRVLLLILLPLFLMVSIWATLQPVVQPAIDTAVRVANPIAEATATRTPTLTPAPEPEIEIAFELPSGVSMSALQVQKGDRIEEGQTLATWERTPPPAHPTPTRPVIPDPPAILGDDPGQDSSSAALLLEAEAALAALETRHAGEREHLQAAQQATAQAAQQALTNAATALAGSERAAEHDLAVQQRAVAAEATAIADARDLADLVGDENPATALRAREQIHAAEADLEREQAELARLEDEHDQAQAAAAATATAAAARLETLPAAQEAERARLETEHNAERSVAEARVNAARLRADAANQARAQAQQAQAATATAIIAQWQQAYTATTTSHNAAAWETAVAQTTPEPNNVTSRVDGWIVDIRAEERDGRLVVTLAVAGNARNK